MLREAYRLQKNILPPTHNGFALFFIYTGKALPDYATLYQTMSLVLNKLAKEIAQINSTA
jgi:ribonuclease P protein component